MKPTTDPVLLSLFIALLITVGLFLLDVFPYPFGFIVLILLILTRFYATRGGQR